MHSLLQDLEFIVELCEKGAFAKRTWDEASLQLVSDVMPCRYLLLGVSRLGQQLQKQIRTLGPERHQEALQLVHQMSGVYLALYEGSQQDKDRDTSPDNEVNEVPEGQAAHFSQSHLLHLQAQTVPLVPQRALKANQHHLQSCQKGEDE